MMKKVAAVLLFALILASGRDNAAWGLFGLGEKTKERTVTINAGYFAFDFFSSVLIKEKGLAEKYMPEGVTVKYTGMIGGPEQRDALLSGNADIISISVVFLASGLQNGLPLTYLAYSGANLYQLYARDPNIKTLADFKPEHKISASAIGGNPHTALLLASMKDLGNVSKFQNSVVVMHNADAVSALMSGVKGVDASICTFPTIVAVWNSDKVHLVRDLTSEIIEYGTGSVFLTLQDYARDNPDIIEAFLKAYDEAVSLLHNNKPECVKIMQKAYKDIDEATASKMLDYYTASIDGGLKNYDKLMDFLYNNGILEHPAAKFSDIPKYTRSGK